MGVMEHFRNLRDDLREKQWFITTFDFRYRNREYIVLVSLVDEDKEKPDKYTLVRVEFDRRENIADSLKTYANTIKLYATAREIRAFFCIPFVESFGDAVQSFYRLLNESIPKTVMKPEEEHKLAIERSMSRMFPSEDPNKIYCFAAKHNPLRSDGKPGQRTVYNDTVTRIRRPSLYDKLHEDKSISFCYSNDPNKRRGDPEILSSIM